MEPSNILVLGSILFFLLFVICMLLKCSAPIFWHFKISQRTQCPSKIRDRITPFLDKQTKTEKCRFSRKRPKSLFATVISFTVPVIRGFLRENKQKAEDNVWISSRKMELLIEEMRYSFFIQRP